MAPSDGLGQERLGSAKAAFAFEESFHRPRAYPRRWALPGCFLERAVVTCSTDELRKKHLSPDFGQPAPTGSEYGLNLRDGVTVEEAERRLIHETLAYTQNNKTRAAQMLGISLKTLHNKLRGYVGVGNGTLARG